MNPTPSQSQNAAPAPRPVSVPAHGPSSLSFGETKKCSPPLPDPLREIEASGGRTQEPGFFFNLPTVVTDRVWGPLLQLISSWLMTKKPPTRPVARHVLSQALPTRDGRPVPSVQSGCSLRARPASAQVTCSKWVPVWGAPLSPGRRLGIVGVWAVTGLATESWGVSPVM